VPERIDHRYSPGVAADGRIFYILREHKKESVALGHARLRKRSMKKRN
jgi:hypothetical protein